MNYFLRITDTETWKKARIKTIEKGTTLRNVIEKLLKMWVMGKIKW